MSLVYLTALTNERYLPGVMALARSLHEVKSAYDLAIMIPVEKADSLEAAIREYGILDIPGTYLLPKENVRVPEMDVIVEEKYSYWSATFFKLQAASCVEFEKIILLDSDMLVARNIDHLFGCPSFTATVGGKCVHDDWHSLNSGMLVLEPSLALYEKLISLVIPAIRYKESKGLQAGDQDVFQMAFPEWRDHPELCVSEKYNICWSWIGNLCRKEKCTSKDMHVIHFVGKDKPWDYGKYHHLRILVSNIVRRKWDKLFYKVYIWHKYRSLCNRA